MQFAGSTSARTGTNLKSTGTYLEGETGRQHLLYIVPLLLEDTVAPSESVGSQRKVVPARGN